ncbi:PAX-interacting protein 1 [Cephus cinctus]|uniref:PAX-interacting protein 1 n=1 Tax=Cephus cinctus TaxID=211228 RepID=A0AAJ7CES0_CEPCN|nr:PAX-interacting protein 1 [Cephus cinctus]
MEKEQPDSLATVAVGSEKIPPPPHSHYAPSEVYSTAEPPPAYMRPNTKSTAVQIARIAAITLVTMCVVLGSFILAASWVQARASCTPESIAAMQAQMKTQQIHQAEYFKHLQPEALVQDPIESKENLQSLSESAITKKEVQPDTKDIKVQQKVEDTKTENDTNDVDEEDDYDDDEFPPVHIKLPLQLDLDDIAGALMQQARSRVSCVVERRRADEVMDGSDNGIENRTDPGRFQRLSGERVAILCESGNPHQEQQEQEMMTPIIVPLGTVQIPLQNSEPNFSQYQINTQYQVPDMQQLPLSDSRGLNHIPSGLLLPELRNLPQLTVEMRPPRMGPQSMEPQMEMRQIPIELRHFSMDPMRAMRPPMERHEQPNMFQHPEYRMLPQDQHTPPMMPPPQQEQMTQEHRVPQMMMPPQQTEQRPLVAPSAPEQPALEAPRPLQSLPMEIRRIIQQVPLEIKNIIQHITDDSRPFPIQVPDGARRENVHEFKPFPEGARPIPLGPFPLPVEVRNLLEHGNIEGRHQQQMENNDERQQVAKPFPSPDDQIEEVERNFPIPIEVRNLIHQVVEGRAFPVPRFPLPLRPVQSLEVPVEARAQVSDEQTNEQQEAQQDLQDQQGPSMIHAQQNQEQSEEDRPHYVQPRSVRSVPEPFAAHRREKRVRRCACDCAC